MKSKLTTSEWNRDEGFYYGHEDVPQWYTKFTPSAVSTDFDNPVVKNMKYISGIVKGAEKKMLWIPYYNNGNAIPGTEEIPTRIGNIINKTNYFNYAILQPSYYSNSSYGSTNLTLIKNCVDSQTCKDAFGTIMGGSKTSSTEIGAEMEIDDKISNSAYLGRYNEYVSKFGTYISGSPKRITAFYADGVSTLIGITGVYNRVKNFFTSGT